MIQCNRCQKIQGRECVASCIFEYHNAFRKRLSTWSWVSWMSFVLFGDLRRPIVLQLVKVKGSLGLPGNVECTWVLRQRTSLFQIGVPCKEVSFLLAFRRLRLTYQVGNTCFAFSDSGLCQLVRRLVPEFRTRSLNQAAKPSSYAV